MNAAIPMQRDERQQQRLRTMVERLDAGERVTLASILRESLDLGGRTPPHNLDVEASVLSAIICSHGRALDEVVDVLPNGDPFYSDAHRRIFDAAIAIHAKGQPVDVRTLGEYLKQIDRLEAVGGLTYIAKIIDATPAIESAAAHARIVREKFRVRQLIDTCGMVAADAHGNYGDAATFIATAADRVAEIAEHDVPTRLQTAEEIGHARDAELRAQWAGQRDPWGMRGPHERLHALTQGHGLGEQTYVAADTGGGKSAFALQHALHLAGRKYAGETIGVGYLSLEMPSKRHYDRGVLHLAHAMAEEARVRPVSMRELQTGREDIVDSGGRARAGLEPLDGSRIWLLEQAQKKLRSLPIDFDDAGKDIANTRAVARQMQRRFRDRGARLRLLVIDHMHIMTFPDARREDEAIAMMVKAFNELAKDLELHLMVLAQFNRGASSTSDGVPRREHIRGAAAIEQIAHKIVLLHRPWLRLSLDAKRKAPPEQAREAVAIVAKNRDGREGAIPMSFIGEAFRFDEVDE